MNTSSKTPFLLLSLLTGFIGALLALYLVMNLGFGWTSSVESTASVVETHTVVESSYTDTWEIASPSVVSIVALKDLSTYYEQFTQNKAQIPPGPNGPSGSIFPQSTNGSLTEVSSGTAFLVSEDGLALSNKHVVEDESAEYVAILDDGTELDVTVLERDPLNDIAILQVEKGDDYDAAFPALEFFNSDYLQVGEPVIAIGNALGEYSHTTTAGIVSATGRQIIAAGSSGAESLVDLIQTDAAINPGNSGGPLLNLAGEVIGMNTAVDSSAQGIGFAISSNDLLLVLDSYEEYGRIVRPYLGIRYMLVNPSIQKRFELEYDYGAILLGDKFASKSAVESGSSADQAGLQEFDVILSFNDVEVNANYTLSNAISEYAVGETVLLEVWRDGEILELEMELEEQ